VRPEASWPQAALYGWLVAGGAGTLVGLAATPLQQRLGDAFPGWGGGGGERLWVEWTAAGLLWRTLAGVLLFPLLLLVLSGAVHATARLFAAGHGGFGATVRALAYASAPLLLAQVPCLAVPALLAWGLLATWGLKELHGSRWEGALGALGVPLLLGGCCACCVGMPLVGSMAAAFGG
jgi:hypothetical protein